MPEGLNDATSRKTFCVVSLHPLANPPITPAIPWIFLESEMTVFIFESL